MIPASFRLPVLRLLNRVLDDYPAAQSRLAQFAGKTILYRVGFISTQLRITPEGRFDLVGDDANIRPDVSLTIPFHLLPLLALKQESAFQQVLFTGDSELAALIGELARHLKWDIEEDLSHVMGDSAAHRVVDSAKSLHAWGSDAATRLSENISEYLTEERQLLIPQQEAEGFTRQVEALREDIERLEKRIGKLT